MWSFTHQHHFNFLDNYFVHYILINLAFCYPLIYVLLTQLQRNEDQSIKGTIMQRLEMFTFCNHVVIAVWQPVILRTCCFAKIQYVSYSYYSQFLTWQSANTDYFSLLKHKSLYYYSWRFLKSQFCSEMTSCCGKITWSYIRCVTNQLRIVAIGHAAKQLAL